MALTALVALEDIADVWGFVAATLQRFESDADFTLESDERDELQLEGIVILYELAEKYEPHRPGYAQPGRFSGYAAMYLPRRLGDAWHRRHPEHVYATDPATGKRGWKFLKSTVSLDEQLSARGRAEHFAGFEADESRFLERSKWTPVPAASPAA